MWSRRGHSSLNALTQRGTEFSLHDGTINTPNNAVNNRNSLCRLYKANPTQDNWLALKKGNACRKILK